MMQFDGMVDLLLDCLDVLSDRRALSVSSSCSVFMTYTYIFLLCAEKVNVLQMFAVAGVIDADTHASVVNAILRQALPPYSLSEYLHVYCYFCDRIRISPRSSIAPLPSRLICSPTPLPR